MIIVDMVPNHCQLSALLIVFLSFLSLVYTDAGGEGQLSKDAWIFVIVGDTHSGEKPTHTLRRNPERLVVGHNSKMPPAQTSCLVVAYQKSDEHLKL